MLYLVATPIGNLGDITLRALEPCAVWTWSPARTPQDRFLAEAFRHPQPQMAFHEHNEDRAGERIMGLLAEGKAVAVVTEAGTPGISDPGYTIVQRAIAAGEDVTMIPGASAAVMALVLSGLRFTALPTAASRLTSPGPATLSGSGSGIPHTLVFYESLYRLEAFLRDALAIYGDRPAALAHELTKLHESVVRGRLSELIESLRQSKPKGEYVVVIAGQVRPDILRSRGSSYV